MYTEYIKDFDKASQCINETYGTNPKFKAVMDELHVILALDGFIVSCLFYMIYIALSIFKTFSGQNNKNPLYCNQFLKMQCSTLLTVEY